MPSINFDEKVLTKLAEILNKEGLSEIEITEGDKTIRVAKNLNVAANTFIPSASVSAPAAVVAEKKEEIADLSKHPGALVSPMVGTVYLQSEPGAAPFVKVGDTVSQGQTLLVIEAMKVMNPIKSAKAGKVKQILVSDAQPVEYGEVLLVIE